MVNLSYQDRNLSMSIAIIYTQHYIITPAIPILNHQPHGFIFEIRRVIYKVNYYFCKPGGNFIFKQQKNGNC